MRRRRPGPLAGLVACRHDGDVPLPRDNGGMKIRSVSGVLALALLGSSAFGQTGSGTRTGSDGFHLWDWIPTLHLANYTEWWYFNVYDAADDVQAIFSYFVTDPLNLPGGLLPVGLAEMGVVAYTPQGIVTEQDPFLTLSFGARYNEADVNVGLQNSVRVLDADRYQITGATRDGKIRWDLVYKREEPAWYAGDAFNVAAEPWQRMSWLINMPRALVTGTLTVNGAIYNVNSPGYHDHNWGEWDLNGVRWNWAQYSQPGFTFDLGDFPDKADGTASVELNGHRYVFQHDQYSLVHTQWAYDSTNKVSYPTQSVFHGSSDDAQIDVTMEVINTDALRSPSAPPRAVIYEQTMTYTGQAWVAGQLVQISGDGFKEFTGIAP